MGVWKERVAGVWVDQPGVVVGSGNSMSAFELYHWQVRAALLDPLAYELVVGSVQSVTVPADETYYLVDAWKCDTGSSGLILHRKPDVVNGNVVPLKEGETFTTDANAGAHFLICKPNDVITTDSRYTSDPRALFYERLYRIDVELDHYDAGHNNTGTGSGSLTTTTFPADFTYGMVIHVSAHDVAWCGLHHTSSALTLNLNNEISDDDRIRFSERMTVPFTRTEFPRVSSRGAGEAEGTCNVRYVKLPGDW